MKRYCSLLLTVFLTGCATALKITPGRYVETPETGILWIGHTLTLHSNYTFSYARWSDDKAANEYGTGTYQLHQKMLTLSFDKQLPLPTSQAKTHLINSESDSLVFTFSVVANLQNKAGVEPVPYATIIASDVSGNTVASVPADEQGHAILCIARAAKPQELQISFLGYSTYHQPCPAGSTAFQVLLEPKRGTSVQAGLVKKHPIVSVADSQLTVLWNNQKMHFTLRP